MPSEALQGLRICDFTGQLAGAGATRFLAAFGAEVIRIEDPSNQGRWDILRGIPPYLDERRGIDMGGAFNNHNVEKLGVTINLRTERGKQLFEQLVAVSDVVTENFAAGVLERLGYTYEELRAIRPDIIYVSNCGFGHTGPYKNFKTWGPIVQAMSGLTFSSGLPGQPPAGWGYSYMDHTGAYYMAIAILMALHHRNMTGEGQWVDYSTVEAATALNGPALLDYTVNGRPLRREGMPNSNRSQQPAMAPHGIYPALEEDTWVALACRDDAEWGRLAGMIGEGWAADGALAGLLGRLAQEDRLDNGVAAWTRLRDPSATASLLQEAGIPATAVQSPEQRIDLDANTSEWGLWPTVKQSAMGEVRVDGLPAHLSRTDWELARGAPCLGEHNERVFCGLLGLAREELESLREAGVI
jgi:crotonobetainyl-CoA:carnitine CoA-transferase CaiB-like acyl-CoA transferase